MLDTRRRRKSSDTSSWSEVLGLFNEICVECGNSVENVTESPPRFGLPKLRRGFFDSFQFPNGFIKEAAAVLQPQPETAALQFPFHAAVPHGQIVRRQRQGKCRATPRAGTAFLAKAFSSRTRRTTSDSRSVTKSSGTACSSAGPGFSARNRSSSTGVSSAGSCLSGSGFGSSSKSRYKICPYPMPSPKENSGPSLVSA